MSNLLIDWTVFKYLRELCVFAIVAPSLVLSTFNLGEWKYLLASIEDPVIQQYLIFVLFAFAFSYYLLKNLYRSWLLFYGLGLSFIGFAQVLSLIYSWEERLREGGINYIYLSLWTLPVLGVSAATALIWRQQDLQIPMNSKTDRLISMSGLLLTIVLMFAEFLPWVRDIYKATSSTWEFKGSGSKTLIQECCYLTEYGLNISLQIYLPLVGLGLLFLISILGFQVPNISFLPSLGWCIQESIDFFTSLGVQEPIDTWSEKEVIDNGLTHSTEGLFGGYLFVSCVLALISILLIPRVLNGRTTSFEF
jgi:hypothetical protein